MEDFSFTENKIKYIISLDIDGEYYKIKGTINDNLMEDKEYTRTELLNVVQDFIKDDVKYLMRGFIENKTTKK